MRGKGWECKGPCLKEEGEFRKDTPARTRSKLSESEGKIERGRRSYSVVVACAGQLTKRGRKEMLSKEGRKKAWDSTRTPSLEGRPTLLEDQVRTKGGNC